MDRDSGHYALPFAVAVEGLTYHLDDPQEIFRRAHLFATANACVDAMDDKHVTVKGWQPGDPRTITQVEATRGISLSLVLGSAWTRDYEAVHRHHFQPPADMEGERLASRLHMLTDAEIVEAGTLWHTMQDCGYKGCPHRGYSGVPSPANKARTAALGRLAWYKRPFPAARTWGHCLYPDADKIQNCREGAVESAVELYELVSGGRVRCIGETFDSEVVYVNERGERVESVMAVANARNDADLMARCGRVVLARTGMEMPPFKRLEGEHLTMFWNVVRGG